MFKRIYPIFVILLSVTACESQREIVENTQSNAAAVPIESESTKTQPTEITTHSNQTQTIETSEQTTETTEINKPSNLSAPESPQTHENTDAPEVPAEKAAESRLSALSLEQRKIISDIAWDEKPEILYAVEEEKIGQHYLISDEKHPDLFRSSIENLGGTYIGVGTDQGYLYIGWQKPEFAILIDYDPIVVELHQFILAFIGICETSDCLKKYVNDSKSALEWIQSEAGTLAGLNTPRMIHRYHRLNKTMAKALNRLHDMAEPTMMNDESIYQYIHSLVTGGRITTVQANLLDKMGIKSIASGLKQLKTEVTVLYLSNAEQYWNYSDDFKQNMLSLPFASNGLILRTSAAYPQNGDYRYSIQSAQIFRTWMERKRTKNVKQMLKKVHIRAEEYPFVIDDILPVPGGK